MKKAPDLKDDLKNKKASEVNTPGLFAIRCSALAIIDDICKGNLDPQKLAEHRHGNCKKSYDEIAKALKGNNRKDYLFGLKQEYESYLFFQKKIDDCDRQINSFLKVQINTDPVKKNFVPMRSLTSESTKMH